MGFFEHYFNIVGESGEVSVLCPFPHHTTNGIQYKESNPSAHVNTINRVFHCKVCGDGYNEVNFIAKIFECTTGNAVRLSKAYNNSETIAELEATSCLDKDGEALCTKLGIDIGVAKELHIVNTSPDELIFPVEIDGKIIDIRKYRPGGTPKVKSREGSIPGCLMPMEQWQKCSLNKMMYICAGEKDMATSRSHGLNAYTLTTGEGTLPFSPVPFKGRNITILYDNDDAGKTGAIKLATYLLPYVNTVRVVNKFHEICKENKEDMTDFWNKYNGTKEQIIQWTKGTDLFTQADSIMLTNSIPLVTLAEATSTKYINKLVKSNIQVVAVSDIQYQVPRTIVATKTRVSGAPDGDSMYVGQVKDWDLDEHNMQDILHLADGGFKQEDIDKNAKFKLLHVPVKERCVALKYSNKDVLYKGCVTDMFESMNTDSMPMEYTAYAIGTRLESGKKYTCTYKIVPHPYKGQVLTMIIINAVPATDSVSNFKITDETKASLDEFISIPGSTAEKINTLVHKVKGMLGYDGNDTLIELIDLAYHTVLSFNLGTFKNVRGYLDTLIVGESRMGKSSTADALRKCYQLGTFTSLAGNSATIPGLVGGSNKTSNGSMQTKAGIIPQNHKGLIIFEEFGKCNSNITAELTDIRSSNEVRITRVSGAIALPAMVRMISLTNVKNTGNEIKSIASYPNGISIVTELVPTAEDIARYDILCVLGDKGTTQIDPYWKPDEPLPDKVYQDRVRWVWSRTADQIIISEEVGKQIIQCANALNNEYDCHIKIFGTEAWKKLSRLAIAVAGYTVSTDETYENIIVTAEHVTYAMDLYIKLYDNPVFRLKEYVTNERKYNTIDDAGVAGLQNIYNTYAAMILMLAQEARPSKSTLMAAGGLDNNTYNAAMNMLIKGSFVKLSGNDVLPTERFRLGMAKVRRQTGLERVGENNATVGTSNN